MLYSTSRRTPFPLLENTLIRVVRERSLGSEGCHVPCGSLVAALRAPTHTHAYCPGRHTVASGRHWVWWTSSLIAVRPPGGTWLNPGLGAPWGLALGHQRTPLWRVDKSQNRITQEELNQTLATQEEPSRSSESLLLADTEGY